MVIQYVSLGSSEYETPIIYTQNESFKETIYYNFLKITWVLRSTKCKTMNHWYQYDKRNRIIQNYLDKNK